ncbi:MAG: hypothetical protein JJU31_00075 [Wenzhouxiangella sp.]|nr:hypothetical protein [Wenzhouxiangella sp.]
MSAWIPAPPQESEPAMLSAWYLPVSLWLICNKTPFVKNEENQGNVISGPGRRKKTAAIVVFVPRTGVNFTANRVDHTMFVKLQPKIAAIAFLAALLLAPGSWARSLPAGSLAAHSGLTWYLVAFELGPWEQYLIHELTPQLEMLDTGPAPRVSWLHMEEGLLLPDFALGLLGPGRGYTLFSLRQQHVSLPMTEYQNTSSADGMSFRQALIMPGITHQVSERNALTVSAVLASQQFGASGMNLREADDPAGVDRVLLQQAHLRSEVAQGAGMRFALSSALHENLRFEAAYQSRIEMAEFASLQGVHGSRAELDIPSRIQFGLEFLATERSSFNLGVSQIFYSEVGAFPSRAMPARFTALLGDSTSPDFDWSDLVVYNVGWQWQPDAKLTFYIDYRTRSQPKPTAPALARALGPELAQNALLAGVSRSFGQRARLQLDAAYAPPEFAFGGNVLGIVSDKLDQSLEVQAMLRFDF